MRYINQEIVAELDLDDTSSYSPETVTITLDTDLLEDTLNYRLTTEKENKIYLNKSKVLIIYRILIKSRFNCK